MMLCNITSTDCCFNRGYYGKQNLTALLLLAKCLSFIKKYRAMFFSIIYLHKWRFTRSHKAFVL